MLSSAIIVFRESLEAALIIGIVAAAARSLPQRDRWLWGGFAFGIFGSLLVAASARQIAGLANGMGQELFNASVLGLAVLMLAWHNIWMSRHAREQVREAKSMIRSVTEGSRGLSVIAVVVGLAVLREGSETVLFLYGIAFQGEAAAQLVLGSVIGLVSGALLGFGLYVGLVRVPVRWFFSVTAGLVLLVAAGMAGQMAHFLVQGDILPPLVSPIWDSSTFLSSRSTLGTLLHTLIGYDDRPSGMQTIFYLAALAFIGLGMYLSRRVGDNVRASATA
jgi:high-affinity iron transporter